MAGRTDRREWLSLVVSGAAAATLGPLAPSSEAQQLPESSDDRIKHIVVLMLENRSFDHMLGLLKADIPKLDGVRIGEHVNVDDSGKRHEVTDRAAYQGQFTVDPPHDFESVRRQIYYQPGSAETQSPKMLGFASTYARAGGDPANIMRCFQPDQLPTLTALAKSYVVCDRWFASVPGPTNPNRAFAHFGTSFGRLDNGPIWFQGLREHGIYGRLRDRGKRGKIYYFNQESGSIGMTFLGASYFGLYQDFVNDCRSNNLPHYAFIEPPYLDQDDGTLAADQHPDSFVLAGDHFIRSVYEAIRSNEKVWRSTLFLIVWDEHGGIYDHVAPPTLLYGDTFRSSAPPFAFDRLGVRVGAVVVSPYVRPDVCHDVTFEHASIPATVTRQFIGDPAIHAPYRREQKASTLLPLLLDIPPRTDWPFPPPSPRRKANDHNQRPEGILRPASSLQRAHVSEVYALLARREPAVARTLDPVTIATQKDVAAFMSTAMAALCPELERGHA